LAETEALRHFGVGRARGIQPSDEAAGFSRVALFALRQAVQAEDLEHVRGAVFSKALPELVDGITEDRARPFAVERALRIGRDGLDAAVLELEDELARRLARLPAP